MNAPPVSVMLLCDHLATAGGVERFVCGLANYLSCQGLQVVIGSTDAANAGAFYALEPGIRILGADNNPSRSPVGAAPLGRSWNMLREQWRRGRLISAFIRQERPSVVILNGLTLACSTLLFLRGQGAAVICCDHNHFAARSGVWQRLRSLLYPRVSALVSLTQADASKFAALNPRTRVIYNASTLRATAPAETNGLQVLAVGRHVEQKGFDLLLRAWPAVLNRVPEARLRIVGDGPLRTSLTAQAHALGISPTVQWIEQTKEMVDEYRSAAVFVLPSRYEGMPLALLEAQALGVPAVAFDCPTGPREVIGADTGIVVPPLSVNALAGALTSLLVQPDVRKRMALAAIERSQRLFDPQRQQEQWLTLILETAKLSEGRRQWTQTF